MEGLLVIAAGIVFLLWAERPLARISFLAVLEEKGSRSTAAMQWFSHYCNVRYSFRCRSDLRICPIVPFRRPQRAFWQQLPRADASVTR